MDIACLREQTVLLLETAVFCTELLLKIGPGSRRRVMMAAALYSLWRMFCEVCPPFPPCPEPSPTDVVLTSSPEAWETKAV